MCSRYFWILTYWNHLTLQYFFADILPLWLHNLQYIKNFKGNMHENVHNRVLKITETGFGDKIKIAL